jgi:hypothetical protein
MIVSRISPEMKLSENCSSRPAKVTLLKFFIRTRPLQVAAAMMTMMSSCVGRRREQENRSYGGLLDSKVFFFSILNLTVTD